MREKFNCLKNWGVESGIYFEEGKEYEGIRLKSTGSVRMFGEVGMEITFHKDNVYFKIWY